MRLIDADKLKELLHEYCIDNDPYCRQVYDFLGIDDVIDDAYIRPYEKGYNKAKQKYERPTGEWIQKCDDNFDWYECSCCGYGDEGELEKRPGFKFCPNCGSRMMEEE